MLGWHFYCGFINNVLTNAKCNKEDRATISKGDEWAKETEF